MLAIWKHAEGESTEKVEKRDFRAVSNGYKPPQNLLPHSPFVIIFSVLSILRVRVKWLIFNMVSLLWADVKYHVPTGFFAEGELFFMFLFQSPSIFPLNQ